MEGHVDRGRVNREGHALRALRHGYGSVRVGERFKRYGDGSQLGCFRAVNLVAGAAVGRAPAIAMPMAAPVVGL